MSTLSGTLTFELAKNVHFLCLDFFAAPSPADSLVNHKLHNFYVILRACERVALACRLWVNSFFGPTAIRDVGRTNRFCFSHHPTPSFFAVCSFMARCALDFGPWRICAVLILEPSVQFQWTLPSCSRELLLATGSAASASIWLIAFS